MQVDDVLHAVESKITDPAERTYFLVHESRYKTILEEIVALRQAQGQNAQKFRILDVGCYPYHLGAALEMMGAEVYGIASSHEPIKNKKIAILNIETDKFPYKDNFFDGVLCSEVIEHLPHSPVPALTEMYRVTKQGGHVLLTTPNITRSINQGKMLLGKSPIPPITPGENVYHRHNHEYTLGELKKLVSHAGWHVTRAIHFVSYTPFRKKNKSDHPMLKAAKHANYALMRAIPRLADTLLVIGTK